MIIVSVSAFILLALALQQNLLGEVKTTIQGIRSGVMEGMG